MLDLRSLLRGPIRHMKRIGDDPAHQRLRARNEERLAKLKAADRLYEDKNATPTASESAALRAYSQLANAAYNEQAQLAAARNYGYQPECGALDVFGIFDTH